LKKEKTTMKQSKLPQGWDLNRVEKVLKYYESQSEEDAVAEDEEAFERPRQTVMEIPIDLVPIVRELIAKTKKYKVR
jgi:hypothetical protein